MQMLIVEDDKLHRAFLKSAVEDALPDCTVVQEAEDGTSAVSQAEASQLTSVVLDLQLPRLNGVETEKRL